MSACFSWTMRVACWFCGSSWGVSVFVVAVDHDRDPRLLLRRARPLLGMERGRT